MYRRHANGWLKHIDFFIIDVIVLFFILTFVYSIRFNAWIFTDTKYMRLYMTIFFCEAFAIQCFNTMHNVLQRGFYVEFRETFRHCVLTYGIVLISLFLANSRTDYSQRILFVTAILHLFLGYGARVMWKWFITNYRLPFLPRKKVFVVLDPETAEKTMKRINHKPEENYDIVGVIMNGETELTEIDGVQIVAGIEEAALYVSQKAVDSVYVDCSIADSRVSRFIDLCMEMAIPIHSKLLTPYGEGIKYYVEKVGGKAVLTSSLNFTSIRDQTSKRLMDIIGGLIGSVLAVLLILMFGPLIKKASPGPILFAQERIGLNGRRFKMYKLRSMCIDADQKKKDLMDQNTVADGRMFKMDFDPRIIGNEILPDGTKKTGIGDFIRKTSLDEFPQFFNVLLGQMSLVGTRPPTVDEWETYTFHHRARMACKPGITGLWQTSGRSEIKDFEKVVRLDMMYVKNWSIGLDLRILLKTVLVVFERKGAL